LALCELPRALAHLLVFKDGFVIQGTTKRGSQPLVDPSGKSFAVPTPGGFYTIDDGVRNIIFSPGQLQDVIRDDQTRSVKPIAFTGPTPRVIGDLLPAPWTIDTVEPWDKWARTIRLATAARGPVNIQQRLTLLTPQRARVDAYKVDWISYYKTPELGVQTVRDLLGQYFAKTKENEPDKRLLTTKFLIQAGYAEAAEDEIEKLLKEFPDQKDKTEPLLKTVREMRATDFIDAMEQARKVGQYEAVRKGVAQLAKLGLMPYATEKSLVLLQDLKNKQQEADDKLKQAQRLLQELPQRIEAEQRDFFQEATAAIVAELNLDTMARLELFLGQAPSHERDIKEGRKPAQTTEELMALAISSWVLGDGGGDTKVETAKRLWETRKFLVNYLKADQGSARKGLLGSYQSSQPAGLDEIARVIRFLPPVQPYEKLGTAPFRLEFTDPDAGMNGTVVVQLPPEYHHFRSYPVLFVLHQADEKPLDMINRWKVLAAQHGYILAAPEWASGQRSTYNYTAREHATVVQALGVLRRRFQIDSDRVFLFGYGQGGQMAYDVGLAHPDLFAGVLPMSASPIYFPTKYATNAQFLPFYVINGDRTGNSAKESRALFKEWVRWSYPSFYVEYKGRGVEWFGAELPTMFDWMGRKKRAHPLRELGRFNSANPLAGEEFKTMRLTDNRFYWLTTDEVQGLYVNKVPKWNARLTPAMLQASIFSDNKIYVRTTGVNQVTVWLGPSMIDFNKKVTLRINGRDSRPIQVRPSLEIMLDDFFQRGDRQQLYFARVAAKL
jgi:pimeloyl-ACP methyl ester carboxylesterase